MSDATDALFGFPCTFPIKAMGRSAGDFESLIVDIVRRHVPDLDASTITRRESRGGKWVSITLSVEAESKDQIDAIYRELSAHERVVWAL